MTTSTATAADSDLLTVVRAHHDAELQAGRAKLAAVVEWAAGHRVAGLADLVSGEVYADHEVELAGPGAPGVSEFAVVELAAALAMTPASAKRYVGDALELAHRLPMLWARVVAGDLPAWRARPIAQRTKQLSADAAAWVDARVGPLAHRLGYARIARLVEQAITLFDAEVESETIEDLHAQTYVTITPLGAGAPGGGIGLGDLARVDALLPLPDALALDTALSARARDLLGDHPGAGVDQRRALALGAIADGLLVAEGRDLNLTVHLGEPDLAGHHLATLRTSGGRMHTVTTEAVATWCQAPATRVSVRTVFDPDVLAEAGRHRLAGPAFTPIATGKTVLADIRTWTGPSRRHVRRRSPIDLTTSISCQGYAPSHRLREQVRLLSPTCAFPHCTVPTERCDLDHIHPWLSGGATTTLNLAPLCRLHHRAKTHGGWTYHQPTFGTYHWSSPTGDRYQRTKSGTTEMRKVSDPTPPPHTECEGASAPPRSVPRSV